MRTLLFFSLAVLSALPCWAQNLKAGQSWTYTLTGDIQLSGGGSLFYRDCPICGIAIRPVPLRGTFRLTLKQETADQSDFDITEISWTASNGSDLQYKLSGAGTLSIFKSSPAQQVSLNLKVEAGGMTEDLHFENEIKDLVRSWPNLDFTFKETPSSFTRQYNGHVTASPFRDLWYAPARDVIGNGSFLASKGDLMSMSGRKIKSWTDLTAKFNVIPPPSPVGLDAFDVAPGGVMLFSLDVTIPTKSGTNLDHGDLLRADGTKVSNENLMAKFGLQPIAPDTGLDALQQMDNGQIWFSISSNVFSENLGVQLSRGDILSNDGKVIKTSQELLSNFGADPADGDYGLASIYVWPSGEVWFTTEADITNSKFGPLYSGDILSDQGYLVYRQEEVLQNLGSVPSDQKFGIHALYVISDAVTGANAPTITKLTRNAAGQVTLEWSGSGHVYQVQAAGQVGGPFLPVSDYQVETVWNDPQPNSTEKFYQVLQW